MLLILYNCWILCSFLCWWVVMKQCHNCQQTGWTLFSNWHCRCCNKSLGWLFLENYCFHDYINGTAVCLVVLVVVVCWLTPSLNITWCSAWSSNSTVCITLLSKGPDCVVWSCGTLLSTPPPTVVGGVDNRVPQLHTTQSEPFDYTLFCNAFIRLWVV